MTYFIYWGKIYSEPKSYWTNGRSIRKHLHVFMSTMIVWSTLFQRRVVVVTRTVTPVAGPAGAVRRGGPNPYHRLSNEEVPPPGQGYAPPPAGMYRGECRPEAANFLTPHTDFCSSDWFQTWKVYLIYYVWWSSILLILREEGDVEIESFWGKGWNFRRLWVINCSFALLNLFINEQNG